MSTPFNAFMHYSGAYLQDDWRVSPKFTLNYGLRLEHEDRAARREQRLHRRLRPHAEPRRRARQRRQPAHRSADPRRPGLRRRQRRQRVPGRPAGDEVLAARRHGLLVQPEDGAPRRLRHLLGAVELPGRRRGQLRQHRLHQDTFISQNQFRPTTSLTNPFPNGVLQPRRQPAAARWPASAARSSSSIRTRRRPRSSSTRWTSTASCRATWRSASSTSGATGRDLGLGGSNDGIININQLDPRYLALGPALLDQVPNPFFGLPNVTSAAPFPRARAPTSATIQRRELLRPFPQFNDILMRQSTLGKSQYHAAIFKFEKRMSNGWGGRINYTYSRLKDNQFGETNFFSTHGRRCDRRNAERLRPRRRVHHRPARRAAQADVLADRRTAVR